MTTTPHKVTARTVFHTSQKNVDDMSPRKLGISAHGPSVTFRNIPKMGSRLSFQMRPDIWASLGSTKWNRTCAIDFSVRTPPRLA